MHRVDVKNMSNRDQRFVAVHRGGTLEKAEHQLMASWAADCAEHVLPLFEKSNSDGRPRDAISLARVWANGDLSVGDARESALAAHAAARAAIEPCAVAVARACGHAVATAHMADHCLGTAHYALKAIAAEDGCTTTEIEWQRANLPEAVRSLVESGLGRKYPKDYQKNS